jgi:hypothetical protein
MGVRRESRQDCRPVAALASRPGPHRRGADRAILHARILRLPPNRHPGKSEAMVRCTLVVLLAALPVHAAEVVVIGRLEQVTLLPVGHARCPSECPAVAPESTELACISSSCGCGEALVAIDDVVAGKVDSATIVATYRLGEWCVAGFPMSGGQVLVRTADGESARWSEIVRQPGGEMQFEVRAFETLAGVRASTLPQVEGRASISALREAAGF